MRKFLLVFSIFLISVYSFAAERRPIQLEDMFKIKRLSDPVASPDGKWVVYTITIPSLEENKTNSDLWLVSSDGGTPRQLTNNSAQDANAAWSPDGRTIAFDSSRGGSSQIWLIDVAGGEARQFTKISTEASQAVWSPDGKTIAFVSAVYPEYSTKSFSESDALNKKKDEDRAHRPVDGDDSPEYGEDDHLE